MATLPLTAEPEPSNSRQKHQTKQQPPAAWHWHQLKNFLTCKRIDHSSSSSSWNKICSLRNTRLVTNKTSAASGKAVQFRKLSGSCYECHTALDPATFLIPPSNIFCCSHCGQVFPKIHSLQLHQALKHAVSELDQDDSSRNIVEIIFKTSWFKPENPICEIERILKVHNTQRTIQRFEDYREAVKLRAKRNARCAADGNELLRFHATTITCSLGACGSSSLCGSVPACGVCMIIRHGFQSNKISGTRTTASSGRADDSLGGSDTRRAMLVCRVIAGRVKPRATEKAADSADVPYDSLAGCGGNYSSVEELYVFSSRAILPCFVVIYN